MRHLGDSGILGKGHSFAFRIYRSCGLGLETTFIIRARESTEDWRHSSTVKDKPIWFVLVELESWEIDSGTYYIKKTALLADSNRERRIRDFRSVLARLLSEVFVWSSYQWHKSFRSYVWILIFLSIGLIFFSYWKSSINSTTISRHSVQSLKILLNCVLRVRFRCATVRSSEPGRKTSSPFGSLVGFHARSRTSFRLFLVERFAVIYSGTFTHATCRLRSANERLSSRVPIAVPRFQRHSRASTPVALPRGRIRSYLEKRA